jgi:DNA-binding NarL/FixJ family response regulator
MIRVLIADDQALVRGGFRMILQQQPDFEVCGEAGDGLEAVALTRQLAPDVVLMDVRMPGVDGIEATRRILGTRSRMLTRVLMLTTFDLDEYVYEALVAGASGFLLKDEDPPELARAVRTVAAGQALLAPGITRRLIESYTRRPRHGIPPQVATLTERELDVFRQVALGRSNAEIAASLFVSPATVKTHVARLLTKLDLRDRVQAVIFAYETGIAQSGSEPFEGREMTATERRPQGRGLRSREIRRCYRETAPDADSG